MNELAVVLVFAAPLFLIWFIVHNVRNLDNDSNWGMGAGHDLELEEMIEEALENGTMQPEDIDDIIMSSGGG